MENRDCISREMACCQLGRDEVVGRGCLRQKGGNSLSVLCPDGGHWLLPDRPWLLQCLWHVCGLQLSLSGATLPCNAWASHCGGFSTAEHRLQGTGVQELELMDSRAWAWQLQHMPQLICSLWDLPGPRIELDYQVSPVQNLTSIIPHKSEQV